MLHWPVPCPSCGHPIELGAAPITCAGCGDVAAPLDGVWRRIAPERRDVVEAFLTDYSRVRRAEGRDASDPARWAALPHTPDDDPLAGQWRMRSVSWRHVRHRVVDELPPGCDVLDLGAGVGWLANRLQELGHHPCAVDLSADSLDGLGAAVGAGAAWPCVQAEFDRLPFLDGAADLAVFNASFHYAPDPLAALLEVRRVLRPGGVVVVMDSPLYRSEAAGREMVAERRADFVRRFGTRSDHLGSIEFLTEAMVAHLAEQAGVRWSRSVAWYGWPWWWRPYRARLHRRREPSRFVTLVGRFA